MSRDRFVVFAQCLDLMVLQMALIIDRAEAGPDLLHRAHFLHLIDDALFAQIVQVSNDECAEGSHIPLIDSIFSFSLSL